MDLAPFFAVHAPGPLGQPVIGACHQCEYRPRHQNVVEMRHYEIAVVILQVHRSEGQHQAGQAANGEQHHKSDGEQHRCLKRHGALPHRADPVENFHAGWNSDQHGGIHEEQAGGQRHADCKHMVSPDNERKERDAGRCVDHGGVTKQWLAGKSRDDFGNHTECRQDQDVDLGVAEEPEYMLEHHRVTAAGGVKETGGEEMIGQQHGDGACQYRHHCDQQEGGDQPGPDKQRHA